MGRLTNKLFAALANRVKAFLPGPGGIGFAGSYPVDSGYDLASLEAAYGVNPWVNACVKRISDTVAAIPLRVYRELPDGQSEEITDGPLVDLLWRPGRFMSGHDLLKESAGELALTGQSIWFVENGSGGNNLYPATPKELRPLKAQFVKIKPHPVDLIEAYMVGGEANPAAKPVKPEFIIHAKTYNPLDSYWGFPPMQVARSPVLLDYYMAIYNQRFFSHGARPDILLTTDRQLNADTRKQIVEAWKAAYRGIDKSRGVAVVDNGLTPKEFGTNAKDGDFINLNKLTREQVLAIFQVPPVMVGVFEFANYANSKQQIQIFYEFTIKPLCDLIAGAINNQLIPRWFEAEKDAYVAFDFSDVAVLQEDIQKLATTDQTYVNAGIKTINEVRADLDLPPVEWGDEPPAKPIPLGLTQPGSMPIDEGAPAGKGRRYAKAKLAPTRADQWKAFDRDLIRNERKVERIMRQFFSDQCARVLAAFDRISVLAAAGIPTGVRTISVDDLFAIFHLDNEDKQIKDALRPAFQSIIDDVGNAALAAIGSDAIFNGKDPAVEAFLMQKLLKVTAINATSKEALREILVNAAAKDMTIAETGRAIRDLFDEFSTSRAETIARTEVLSAQNAATLEAHAQSGVVTGEEWLSSRDDLVRDSHLMVDGTVAHMGGLFANGLRYPGDPTGPPEEVINCRCTVLPVIQD